MKSDKNVNIDDQTQLRIQRVARLPESYLTALEQITDELSKDLMNRLVQTMYVDNLCERFELAIAEGKSVDEVVGPNISAFVEKYQKEVDYRDMTPSQANQVTNALMVSSFVVYLGVSAVAAACSKWMWLHMSVSTLEMASLVVGVLLLIGAFLFKYKKYKQAEMNVLLLGVQVAVLVVSAYFLQFEMISSFITLGVCVLCDLAGSALVNFKK